MTFKQALTELKLTPNALALKARILPPTIYEILRDGNPTLKTCIKLSRVGISTTIKDGKVSFDTK
jgi:predicted transcriptional regulator